MALNKVIGNGIDGASGRYLTAALDPAAVAELALTAAREPAGAHAADLESGNDRRTQPDFGLRRNRAANDLAQAGWAVVFGRSVGDDVVDALRPLLDRRRAEAVAPPGKAHYYREFRGATAPAVGQSARDFMADYAEPGAPADPENFPYYVLLVGSPADIPFRFQYELDVDYAVGRLWFPTAAEYGRYAASVLAAEAADAPRVGRRAALFAPWSPGDEATRLSSDALAPPLAAGLRRDLPAWAVDEILGRDATRDRLTGLLRAGGPAVLFTASHGMYYPVGHARHPDGLGALLCADWPGPKDPPEPIDAAWTVSAADLPADAALTGRVAVLFACYSAGTPRTTDYPHAPGSADPLAERPVVAALPRALLAHPAGGALAVVGHVDRAWTTSFLTDRDQPQVATLQDFLVQVCAGDRVGFAAEALNHRYAAQAVQLTAHLTPLLAHQTLTAAEADRAAELWTGVHDARGYVLLGDPAVRLRPAP